MTDFSASSERHSVLLTGTAQQPLSQYLKALGVLRIIATQVDQGARGRWADGVFELTSRLRPKELTSFLVNTYSPTPLVSPWNNGSGFGQKDPSSSKAAYGALMTIAESDDPRLSDYVATINAARGLTSMPGWYDLTKEEMVALSRSELPDRALAWIDTAVVLTSTSRAFPPLLGTGGNDGRFDFSANYMQRLLILLGVEPRKKSLAGVDDLATAALFGAGDTKLDAIPMGQFDPAGAGGPAAVGFGSAGSMGNPWDFVLLLEGSLLFASGVSRRLSSAAPFASIPFGVAASRSGYSTAATDESSRGELWAPVWEHPATHAEIAYFMGEGRAEYRGRQARSGLDLARAVASLGVDRGITGFVRNTFVERNGLATFAVPVEYRPVRAIDGISVLGQLDRWVDRVRSVPNPPASLVSALGRLDTAQFRAASSNRPSGRLEVLIEASRIDRLAVRSDKLRSVAAPTGLIADDWLPHIDDGSYEFEIARALASLWRPPPPGRRSLGRSVLANLFFDPLEPLAPGRLRSLDARPLATILADSAIALTRETDEVDTAAQSGPVSPFAALASYTARWELVVALAQGRLDDRRLREILGALLLLDWRHQHRTAASADSPNKPHDDQFVRATPTTGYAVLVPWFTTSRWPRPFEDHRSKPPKDWMRRLAAGHVASVCAEATRLYRIAGLDPLIRSTPGQGPQPGQFEDGPALAAALLVPVSTHAVGLMLERVVRSPEFSLAGSTTTTEKKS